MRNSAYAVLSLPVALRGILKMSKNFRECIKVLHASAQDVENNSTKRMVVGKPVHWIGFLKQLIYCTRQPLDWNAVKKRKLIYLDEGVGERLR